MNRNLLFFATLLIAFFAVSCEEDLPTEGEEGPDMTVDTLTTLEGTRFVRTPDVYFQNLPDWPYTYQYVEIGGLRQAYAEAGPVDGPVVLLLHGQPSWSYLYRKMMPILADAGYHVIAMDHLGMGRSDKPIDISDYSYLGHADRLEQFILGLGLQDINLFVQDWGSLIGLRVAGLHPEWFATISVGNGDLVLIPEGTEPFPPVENPNEVEDIPYPFAFFPDQQFPFYDGCNLIIQGDGGNQASGFGDWINYAMKGASFHASEVLESLTWFPMPDNIESAYDAPFPSREYMAGVRTFPSLVNELTGLNQDAWAGLTSYEKPFLTIWGSNDIGFQGSCETQQKFIDEVPGAAGKPHARLPEAGHFLQDDQGEEIARRLVEFYRGNYSGGNFGDGGVVEEKICVEDPSDDPRRYCEILLGFQRNGEIVSEVWGTQGLNTCSSSCLEALDLEAIQATYGALYIELNGPRIWLPRGSADFPEVDTRLYGGLEMRLLASISIDPNDIAGGIEESDPYTENTVLRNTVYVYPAGTEIYELTAPDGSVYVMQSVSLIVDPALTVDDLPNLSSRLNLPSGWTYQARMLSEDLMMVAEGEATVILDDLTNTYQKMAIVSEAAFEIHQIISSNEIITWATQNITQAEFDAIALPQGWFKNQPREGETDFGSFARSPNALVDGELTEEEHFGHTWQHVATIIETGIELDEEGLLSGNSIAKFHTVGFRAGKTLNVLISPEGEHYVRISRDAGRTQEVPTIPGPWQEIEKTITEDLSLQLPNPTLNIRADNEDSYQGPISSELLGL